MRRKIVLTGLLAVCIAGTTIAGIQGSGLRSITVVGRISAVGHLTVNGIEYVAADARVSMDGVAATPDDLRVGQVVTIDGAIDVAAGAVIADEISFVGNARGVVTAVDRDARTFTVLNQTARVTDATVIDDAPALGALNLQVGTTVEASGFENSAGELVVSRVDTNVDAATAQVRGTATALDRHGHTFRINQMLIDYDDAQIEGRLEEGANVVVEGEVASASGNLMAERVEVPAPLGTQGEKGDLEGIITSFASDADFVLNGQRVVGNERTRYDLHGGTLGPDAIVHVSGRFGVGALVADRVEIRRSELRPPPPPPPPSPKKMRKPK
jgi:hypothetical protein